MKKIILLLLCAVFTLVGCNDTVLPDGDNTGNTETPETPVFVVNADGDYAIPASGGTVEVIVATNIKYSWMRQMLEFGDGAWVMIGVIIRDNASIKDISLKDLPNDNFK